MTRHNFHIPVMGTGYTADSPIKVALYGINSVVSLVDDLLLEKLRKYYSELYKIDYKEITQNTIDGRCERITAYLDTVKYIVDQQVIALKNIKSLSDSLLTNYINHLPSSSALKQKIAQCNELETVKKLLAKHVIPGAIDVNIMTKLDKVNYNKQGALPVKYNDALTALRGYANSDLSSSVVFSAGMNPKLYTYLSTFSDFFPDANGHIKKKIILKVSDYRSALIQGKFLAQKGLWVSEYRVESGLNCGGHAFATDGVLLGPVLEDFFQHKKELYNTNFQLFSEALRKQGKDKLVCKPSLKLSVQGGVGTAEEHQFLIERYQLDSVGWGSPFLLVPEATSVDSTTLKQLEQADTKDIYLSHISPLGVRFNNLRGNTKDVEKEINILKNRPGSACKNKFVALDYEFKKEGLCLASREYQYKKIQQVKLNQELSDRQKKQHISSITEKACICSGLGNSILLKYGLLEQPKSDGVSICPGPNLAYFDKTVSLADMIAHIYGKKQLIHKRRPHVFVKEFTLYLEYLEELLVDYSENPNQSKQKRLYRFTENLTKGFHYYQYLFQQDFYLIFPVDLQNKLKQKKKQLPIITSNITQNHN
ncbi:hypothetical protein [Ochrovirga pacifica]|uniref:hypothetical protein n=1 Tax=Ochrovirga pacifica TaxID=1042376 RepID=UPI0002EAB470|nr:hypothetical protein [Ochrovirga pacifica]